jgi:hypothetical protein
VRPGQIFVSYSHADRDCALQLVEWLEARAIGCWIAPRDITPAADWAEEIIDAISAARVMVLVFSATSNQSAQVRREVERAVHKGLMILPFRIAEVTPSKSLEYFLSSQHWLDAFPPPLQPHYAKLSAYLAAVLSSNAPRPDSQTTSVPAFKPAILEITVAGQLSASLLRQIEARLAGYLGPVAKHLVRRAAMNAATIDEVVNRLAAELNTDIDRRRFVDECLK